jgi:hypothetical protein
VGYLGRASIMGARAPYHREEELRSPGFEANGDES